MANTEHENVLGFTDKRRTQTSTINELSNDANYTSVYALRTRLAAINGAYYTSAMLDSMTKNDMVYALRLVDDAAGM